MGVGANMMSISWPGWANDWSLYVTTNLTPPVVWTPVTTTVITNNGNFNVTLPVNATGAKFYQLISP